MTDTIRVAATELAKAAIAKMRGGPIVAVSPERSEKILAILFDSVLDKYDEERAAHKRTRIAVDHLAERVRELKTACLVEANNAIRWHRDCLAAEAKLCAQQQPESRFAAVCRCCCVRPATREAVHREATWRKLCDECLDRNYPSGSVHRGSYFAPDGRRLDGSVEPLPAALPRCVRDWQALSFDDRCVNILTERDSLSQVTITAQHVLQWAMGLTVVPQPTPPLPGGWKFDEHGNAFGPYGVRVWIDCNAMVNFKQTPHCGEPVPLQVIDTIRLKKGTR